MRHHEKTQNSKVHIPIETECLRWSPLLSNVKSIFIDIKPKKNLNATKNHLQNLGEPESDKLLLISSIKEVNKVDQNRKINENIDVTKNRTESIVNHQSNKNIEKDEDVNNDVTCEETCNNNFQEKKFTKENIEKKAALLPRHDESQDGVKLQENTEIHTANVRKRAIDIENSELMKKNEIKKYKSDSDDIKNISNSSERPKIKNLDAETIKGNEAIVEEDGKSLTSRAQRLANRKQSTPFTNKRKHFDRYCYSETVSSSEMTTNSQDVSLNSALENVATFKANETEIESQNNSDFKSHADEMGKCLKNIETSDKPINTVPKLRGKKCGGQNFDEISSKIIDVNPQSDNTLNCAINNKKEVKDIYTTESMSDEDKVTEKIKSETNSFVNSENENGEKVLEAVAKKTKKSIYSEIVVEKADVDSNNHLITSLTKSCHTLANNQSKNLILEDTRNISLDKNDTIKSNYVVAKNNEVKIADSNCDEVNSEKYCLEDEASSVIVTSNPEIINENSVTMQCLESQKVDSNEHKIESTPNNHGNIEDSKNENLNKLLATNSILKGNELSRNVEMKETRETVMVENISDQLQPNNIDCLPKESCSEKPSNNDIESQPQKEDFKFNSSQIKVKCIVNHNLVSTNNNHDDTAEAKADSPILKKQNAHSEFGEKKMETKTFENNEKDMIIKTNLNTDKVQLSKKIIDTGLGPTKSDNDKTALGNSHKERQKSMHSQQPVQIQIKEEEKTVQTMSTTPAVKALLPIHEKIQIKPTEHSQIQNSMDLNTIAPQFQINQLPNYHTSQYWQWDYYGYNLSHLDASAQKTQNKFHKDLATTMAYSHNFTQNLYKSANLAIQHHAHQHMQQQAKDKLRADRKSSTCKKEDKSNGSNPNINNFSRDEAHSCGYGPSTHNYGKSCNNQSKASKVSDQAQHNKPLNTLQNSGTRFYNPSAVLLTSASGNSNSLAQQPICQKSRTETSLSPSNVNSIDENKVKLSHINSAQQQATVASANQEMSTSLVYNTESSANNTNLHHYECGLNVQLSMDSPASIGSDITQNSADAIPPTSVQMQPQSQQFADCSMQNQSANTPMHMTIHTPHVQQQGSLNLNLPSTSSQSINMLGNSQHSQQNRKVNQQADIVTSVSSSAQRSSTPKLIRNSNTSASNQHRQPKSAPPGGTSSSNNVLQHQALSNHLAQSQQDSHHNMQFSQLTGQNNHHQNMQHIDYISIPQIGQNFSGNASSSYDIVSMPAVIQQRMTINSSVHPLSSPHQRLDQSPSACAVNNFYLQNNLSSNEALANSSRIPVSVSSSSTISTPGSGHITSGSTSSSSNASEQQLPQAQGNISESMSSSGNTGTTPTLVGNLCSLSKLQQMTNGLDIQPCNTSPVGQVNLTPPPHHPLPHNSMTPPPHLLVTQNRSLTTPPNMLQSQMAQYHKYYPSNMNIAPIATSQNANRTIRNTPSAPVQHIAATSVSTSSTSSRSTNVHISPNLMTPYGAINGYRMSTQQSPATATYSAGTDYPNSQIPMQMGVMNMQSQYQDACAIQRAAAQQNTMYPTYSPYIPLNGPMRR